MRIFACILGLALAGSLSAQRQKFNWQNYCFDHPAAPFCPGHDYAIKPQPGAKSVAGTPAAKRSRYATYAPGVPSLVSVGAIDWRFADPAAGIVAGFNFSSLSASPVAGKLIAELGAQQGLSEADVAKLFQTLSGLDQLGISIHDGDILMMLSGDFADLTPPQPGWKTVTISGGSLLMGNSAAVDAAIKRIEALGPAADVSRAARQRQAASDLWITGPASLAGPSVMDAGVSRVSLDISLRDRFASDVAFQFPGALNPSPLQNWMLPPGSAAIDNHTVHFRTSMDAAEVQQKLAEILASPLGQRLAALVEAARFLPAIPAD